MDSLGIDTARPAILQPEVMHSRDDVMANPSSIPQAAGLYGWYFDELPPGVPDVGLQWGDSSALLYVGISPKAPPTNRKPASRQTLRSRIRYHYRGNSYGSTLRLTLGCHLASTLDIELRRVGSGTRLTFTPPGEARISQWMAEHARVAVFTHPRPWQIEPQLVAALNLPLNIEHNVGNPYYGNLRTLRAEHRARARALPVWATHGP